MNFLSVFDHFVGLAFKGLTKVKMNILVGYFFLVSINRSSRSQMFFKIGVLKNFAIFTGKHLRWSLFLINKVAGPQLY